MDVIGVVGVMSVAGLNGVVAAAAVGIVNFTKKEPVAFGDCIFAASRILHFGLLSRFK